MPFNKLFLLPALVLALGTGAAVAAATGGSFDPAGSTAVVDVKGPCDEAEHANDPECAGAQVPEDDEEVGEVEDRDDGDEDNSGPSAGSGPSTSSGHSDDAAEEDDNSGPSDSSGPGSGGGEDDNSGSGGGNSGPGGGDD